MNVEQFYRMQSDTTAGGTLMQALGRLQRVDDVEQVRAAQVAARGDWGVWSNVEEDRDGALMQALGRLQRVDDVEQVRAAQVAAKGDWGIWSNVAEDRDGAAEGDAVTEQGGVAP